MWSGGFRRCSGRFPTVSGDSIIQVVLGGMHVINSAKADMRSDEMWSASRLMANYIPPDVLLGHTNFGSDFDIWTLGCVAAELSLRHRLFQGPPEASSSETASCPWQPRTNFPTSTPILDAQLLLVPASSPTLEWIASAPLFHEHYGGDQAKDFLERQPPTLPLTSLRGCPTCLEDFVLKLLRFQPSERLSAASAIQHLFLNPTPVLPRPVSMTMGKNGMGTINIRILTIDGAHGSPPPPQNTISALNRISSEPGLLKIPCGPWHLGQAQAWARAQGFPGPVPGPDRKPWARAQARARPKCHGPHSIFSRPASERIPFRAAMVLMGSGRMPWVP